MDIEGVVEDVHEPTLSDRQEALAELYAEYEEILLEEGELRRRKSATMDKINKAQEGFDACVAAVRSRPPKMSDWANEEIEERKA